MLAPSSLSRSLSFLSPPSAFASAHTLTRPIISHTCTPNCSRSVANPPGLAAGQDATGITSNSSSRQPLLWSPPIADISQPQEGKARRWSHAMEKGVHRNTWANSPPLKASFGYLSPFERQRAHHQTSPPQAASLYFSELKHTSRLFEMSQTVTWNTKICCSEAYAVVLWWRSITRSLFPFSKRSRGVKHNTLNVQHCLYSKLFLLSTLHSLSQPTSAKLKQKSSKIFLVFFQETLYRDRGNLWPMKESRKSLHIPGTIQTAPVSTS